VAVHRDARDEHEAAATRRHGFLEQASRAEHVGPVEGVPRTPIRDARGGVDHRVDTVAQSRDAALVGEVGTDEFEARTIEHRPQVGDVTPGCRERPHRVAGLAQALADMASEEAVRPSDQHLHGRSCPCRASTATSSVRPMTQCNSAGYSTERLRSAMTPNTRLAGAAAIISGNGLPRWTRVAIATCSQMPAAAPQDARATCSTNPR